MVFLLKRRLRYSQILWPESSRTQSIPKTSGEKLSWATRTGKI